MSSESDRFDVLAEPYIRVQASQGFKRGYEVRVLDHLLQQWAMDLEAVEEGLVSVLGFWVLPALLKLRVLCVEDAVDLFVGFVTDPPLCIEDSFSEGL